MRYFGPPAFRKEWEIQIPTPTGHHCMLCEEEIGKDDVGTINAANQIIHYECDLRNVIGSVGHLKRTCSCYGGTEEDPPGMTRREAARAAVTLWESLQKSPLLRNQPEKESNP